MSDTNKLSLLGSSNTQYPENPDDAALETFQNQHPDIDYLVPFKCTEFTSLCPKTGQPDFARLEIVYVPREQMIESKALKLYLFSFRNRGEFHEDVINRIFADLWRVMNPKFMRIVGDFTVRGGIAIKPLVLKYADDANRETVNTLVSNWDNVKHGLL